jgi:hypothetical protein
MPEHPQLALQSAEPGGACLGKHGTQRAVRPAATSLRLPTEAVLSLLALVISATTFAAAPPRDFAPFLDKHCTGCHDSADKKGGLDLESLAFDGSNETHARWVRVFDKVLAGEMPPAKKPRPSTSEKGAFLTKIGGGLMQQHSAMKGTVMRRLNRTEYENTLRDLLGVHTELKTLLPEDGKAFGFDNVGEALDLSAVHMQRYMDAANAALRDAIRFGPAPERQVKSAPFDSGRNAEIVGKHWLKLEDGSVVFFSTGGFPQIMPEFTAPAEGLYRIKITGRAYQTDENVGFSLYAGTFGRNGDTHLISALQMPPKATTLVVETYLRERERLRVFPQIAQDKSFREVGPSAYKGAGLALKPVEFDGPIIAEWPGSGHKLLFGDLETRGSAPTAGKGKFARKTGGNDREIVTNDPAGDAKRLLSAFVPAAFRRPVPADKIAPYLKLAQDELAGGASFHDAMVAAYVAVLCSPDFLFLKEHAGKLDDFALAARMSYMLWSAAPDAELIALASKGQLSKPATLRAQTERLLKDARAERFTKNFTGQWLNLRDIDFTTPDKQLYPEFDDALKDACLRETELFFNEILRGNLTVASFIDSNWTMLNERLARHYGIEGVEGVEFRKVALKPDSHRGGVLTHASILKVSANGTTTSPVIRGTWMLERILGNPAPPPPPGVPGVEPDIRGAQTLRQQLDKHRTLETCNGCHRVIDPP